MNKLELIKEALEFDFLYWEKAEKENPDNAFYKGTVEGLRAFKEKIKVLIE